MKDMKFQPASSFSAVIGALLALERKKLGLNQEEMAEALSITISSWSRLERGVTPITVEQLIAASERLGTKASSLIEQAESFEEVVKERGWTILPVKEIESIKGIDLLGPAGAAISEAFITISNSQLTKQVQSVLSDIKEKTISKK